MSRRPMGPVPVIPERVAAEFQRWLRSRRTGHGLRERILFIQACAALESAASIGRRLGVDPQRVKRWRVRWVAQQAQLAQIVADPEIDDDDLRTYLQDVLADEDRSGAPPKFSAEDVAAIVALACENPEALGLPFSHWSAHDLQQEVLRRQIVSSISVRQVGRFFKRCPPPTP